MIVSQQSYFVKGTLRDNIDPFIKKSQEKQVLKYLEDFGLDKKIQNNLDFEVGAGGSRLSSGEKKIVSFVRAMHLLKEVIVFDEITTRIDEDVEAKMEEKISNFFKEQTIIIISHKLKPLMQCSRIAVFENGRLLECDSPQSLLSNPKSRLAALFKQEK